MLLILITALPAFGAEKIQVMDANGAKVMPLEGKDRKATVFFFITNDCPISNTYAPEIQRIAAAYAPKKIAFYLVYADPSLSAATVQKHVAEYRYKIPALLDPYHKIVNLTGAKATPEVAVIGPTGKPLYRGRIDDRAVDYGKVRVQPNARDLRDALDAILQGKPVAHPTTPVVGCFIPEAAKEPARK